MRKEVCIMRQPGFIIYIELFQKAVSLNRRLELPLLLTLTGYAFHSDRFDERDRMLTQVIFEMSLINNEHYHSNNVKVIFVMSEQICKLKNIFLSVESVFIPFRNENCSFTSIIYGIVSVLPAICRKSCRG
jgi:hypothetical protein